MAKYTITCACGHEHTFELFGAEKDRARKLDWLKTQACPKCRAEANRAKEAEAVKGVELVELDGSEKQVNWATDIRNKVVAEVITACEEEQELLPQVIEIINSNKSAKFWIDNRNYPTMSIVRKLSNSDIDFTNMTFGDAKCILDTVFNI